ncbi:MAG: Gfo/Idh/MocA family protein [Eubacteriales bacterium]|jgi:predicted dehydrogenase
MNKTVNVGIIGTGGIAGFHMAGYKANPNAKVVAVCDIDYEKAKRFAAAHGVPNVYADYNEMLAKESLDAVSVCTWNAAHKAPTIAALNAGVNVICEKPMAMNQAEAEEMLEAAKKNNKLLMIGFVRRFGNDAAILKKFIDGGTMGDVYYAKATYLRRNGCPGRWFGDKEYSGGGPLIDLGVHVMDLVRYLCHNPKPVSAYGYTYDNLGYNRAGGGQTWVASDSTAVKEFKYNVEDFVGAVVRFDNGLTMFVEASFNLNVKKDVGSIELFGTKSGAKIDPQIELFTDMNGMLVDVKPTGDTGLSFNGLFENEIAHFIDCVQNGTPCRSPAEDGVVLMKMIDAIYESAKTGKLVEIK